MTVPRLRAGADREHPAGRHHPAEPQSRRAHPDQARGTEPGGSVKDRIALSMIEEAEKDGLLKPGQTLIEPSSGNTGIGMALICRVKGYHLKVVLATNVSIERRQLLEVWGAEIIESPGSEGSNGAVRRARALAEEHPEWVFLYQYANPANPKAHYEGTGPEIWRDCPEVTHFVAGPGHVGHAAGVGRYLKEQNPDIKVLAIEPPAGEIVDGLRNLDDGYIPPDLHGQPRSRAAGRQEHRPPPGVDRVDPAADRGGHLRRHLVGRGPGRRGQDGGRGSTRAPSWWCRPTADGSTSPPGPGPTTSTWSRNGPSPSPTSDVGGEESLCAGSPASIARRGGHHLPSSRPLDGSPLAGQHRRRRPGPGLLCRHRARLVTGRTGHRSRPRILRGHLHRPTTKGPPAT